MRGAHHQNEPQGGSQGGSSSSRRSLLYVCAGFLDPCARPVCTAPKRTPAAGAGVEATSAAYGPVSLSSTELPPRPRIRGAWSDEACARITLVSSNPTYQVFEHLFEPDTTVAPTSDTRQPLTPVNPWRPVSPVSPNTCGRQGDPAGLGANSGTARRGGSFRARTICRPVGR